MQTNLTPVPFGGLHFSLRKFYQHKLNGTVTASCLPAFSVTHLLDSWIVSGFLL